MSNGNFTDASVLFNQAIEAEPRYNPARFERGRSHLRLGELDLAMNDFGQLAHEKHAKSMACLGYCFNLKSATVAAIPWYERAIRNGATSKEVYNNIGACYITANSPLTRREQLRLAELYLLKALECDNSSITVKLNLVRLAIAKSRLESLDDPFLVWPHAKAVLEARPNDNVIRNHISVWYRAVLRREATDTTTRSQVHLSEAENAARRAFSASQQSVPPFGKEVSVDSSSDPGEGELSWTPLYFLEPFSVDQSPSARPKR